MRKRNMVITSVLVIVILITVAAFLWNEAPEDTANPKNDTANNTEDNDNTENPLYKDSTIPIEDRVSDLLSRMTLEEKIGQMVQAERQAASPSDVINYGIGSILSGGGSVPASNTPEGWVAMVGDYQENALATRLGIPIIYGIDAVHGHNNVQDATIFPHNIGLGAANDVDLMRRIGDATAKEVRATGISYTFAPCLCVPQNIRWGRTYEGYSEDPEVVSELGVAIVQGLQGKPGEDDFLKGDNVATSIKHFIGDGLTENGIDQGDVTEYSEEELQPYIEPFKEAIDAGARTVMITFSSINGLKTHGDHHMITEVLKGELGFDGFVISDYNGPQQVVPNDFEASIKQSINAGIDLFMIPNEWKQFIDTTKKLVENEEVSMERIDDAVTRILRVKMENGLFEEPYANPEVVKQGVGSDSHREIAREAVRKSQVLLKNENNLLPLERNENIVVVGRKADNIGIQSGGWTLAWQGSSDPNLTKGTTILDGIKQVAGQEANVDFSADGTNVQNQDVAIVVVGEEPYAEYEGDATDLQLSQEDYTILQTVEETGVPMVVLLVSGRPMIVTDLVDDWEAFVASWLPGSEGAGIADVLFGDYPFTGKLSYTWPRSMEQINNHDKSDPLFPFGYGLD